MSRSGPASVDGTRVWSKPCPQLPSDPVRVISSNTALTQPKTPRHLPKPPRVWPNWSELGRDHPKVGGHPPRRGRYHRNVAEATPSLGPHQASSGRPHAQNKPERARALVESDPHVGPTSAEFVPDLSDPGPIFIDGGRVSTERRQILFNLGECRPNSAEFGPKLSIPG